MLSIDIRELRQRASKYIALVMHGDTVQVRDPDPLISYGDGPWAGGIGRAGWCDLFALWLATYAKLLRSDDGEANV